MPSSSRIPLLLLKTKSVPRDGYQEFFEAEGLCNFKPTFVPVLEHRFDEQNLDVVKGYLQRREFGSDDKKYGGLIFTSQRAVEAFGRLVEEGKDVTGWPHLQDIPIYTVGPATSRALSSIPQSPPLRIFGAETGNGEALAHHMLQHYSNWYKDLERKPSVLFLVGEQRRDIIPKTLMNSELPVDHRIPVEELVVYGTGVMESFERDFEALLHETEDTNIRWVVVFSPTGCEAMLRTLGMLNGETGRVKTGERGGGCGVRKGKRTTYIATIGPTTRDFLRKSFGFEPDVCAEKPSPEGIREGIERFMKDIEKSTSTLDIDRSVQ